MKWSLYSVHTAKRRLAWLPWIRLSVCLSLFCYPLHCASFLLRLSMSRWLRSLFLLQILSRRGEKFLQIFYIAEIKHQFLRPLHTQILLLLSQLRIHWFLLIKFRSTLSGQSGELRFKFLIITSKQRHTWFLIRRHSLCIIHPSSWGRRSHWARIIQHLAESSSALHTHTMCS